MAGSYEARGQVDQEVDWAASHFNLIDQPVSEVADRFAQEGYVAFAPNLFSRPGLAEVMTHSNNNTTPMYNEAAARGASTFPRWEWTLFGRI